MRRQNIALVVGKLDRGWWQHEAVVLVVFEVFLRIVFEVVLTETRIVFFVLVLRQFTSFLLLFVKNE